MRELASIFEGLVLTYLLNSLWQVPLIFLAALAAARLARASGPRMEHRVWVGALALEALLPFCNLRPNDLWHRAWGLALWIIHGNSADGQTRVILGAGTAAPVALPWHTAEVLGAVAVVYVCGLLYFAGRLGWGAWRTERLRRQAMPLELLGESSMKIARLQRLFGSHGRPGGEVVHFASSPDISGPATVGVRRKTLLVPQGFLDGLSADELDALLAHELAHMARWDFAKNLLYGILALPVAYHPLLSPTRNRLAETRELVCDAMAAEAVGGRESYARFLLRLAGMLSDRSAPRVLHAIGILDANIFERRIMHLTGKKIEIGSGRRLASVAGCVLVALVTCTSALALRMDVADTSAAKANPSSINVKTDALTLVNKVQPVYPADAKKAKIQGSVVLAATIGKDGTMQALHVISGPPELQQSALDAAKQWQYKPYVLNGNPIEVKTRIKIVYSLAQ